MEFAKDWIIRIGQLNDYVAAQYASMPAEGATLEQFFNYLLDALDLDPEYEALYGDESVIKEAAKRIMLD